MSVKRHRIKLNATPNDFARSFAEFQTLNKATWRIKEFVDLMCYLFGFYRLVLCVLCIITYFSEGGLTFLHDHSGKLFLKTRKPTHKDVGANSEVYHSRCLTFSLYKRILANVWISVPFNYIVLVLPMEVVLAVMKVAGCRKLSSHMLKDAILEHFETQNLFPRGLCVLVCVYKQSDVLT